MVKPRTCMISVILLLASSQRPIYGGFGPPREKRQSTGVFYDWGSTDGINFFASAWGTNTYLVNNRGKVLHKWSEPDGYGLGGSAYLTEEGTLLKAVRPKVEEADDNYFRRFLKSGGRIREYDKDSVCIWEFRYFKEIYRQERDMVILPNGNILVTSVENHSLISARARGFEGEADPFPIGYWSHAIIEVPRQGAPNPDYDPNAGVDDLPDNTCLTFSTEEDAIWKWDIFDHSSRFLRPYLWDINKEFEISSIDYHPLRDHIIFMCQPCGEVFIIDHGIPANAAAFRRGHFLYRWGNSTNYGREGLQRLSADNVRWVRDNYGWNFFHQGKVTVFNNNDPAQKEGVSTIVQFDPPFFRGRYLRLRDGTFGPIDFDFKIVQIQEKLTERDFYLNLIANKNKEGEEEEEEEEEMTDGGMGEDTGDGMGDQMNGETDMDQETTDENAMENNTEDQDTTEEIDNYEFMNQGYSNLSWSQDDPDATDSQGRRLFLGQQGLGYSRGYSNSPIFAYPWRNFFSSRLGLVQKLPNGSLIVTSSYGQETFELKLYDRAVWKYVSPFFNTGIREMLLGEDCKLERWSRIPFCGEEQGPCNVVPMMIKYSRKFKGFDVLFGKEEEEEEEEMEETGDGAQEEEEQGAGGMEEQEGEEEQGEEEQIEEEDGQGNQEEENTEEEQTAEEDETEKEGSDDQVQWGQDADWQLQGGNQWLGQGNGQWYGQGNGQWYGQGNGQWSGQGNGQWYGQGNGQGNGQWSGQYQTGGGWP